MAQLEDFLLLHGRFVALQRGLFGFILLAVVLFDFIALPCQVLAAHLLLLAFEAHLVFLRLEVALQLEKLLSNLVLAVPTYHLNRAEAVLSVVYVLDAARTLQLRQVGRACLVNRAGGLLQCSVPVLVAYTHLRAGKRDRPALAVLEQLRLVVQRDQLLLWRR